MEIFQFIELTPKQFIKAVRRNNQRLMRALPAHWLLQLLSAAMVAAPTFILMYTSDLLHGQYAAAIKPVRIAGLLTLAAFMLYTVLHYFSFNHVLRRSKRFVGSKTTVTLEENGLRTASSHGEAFTPWTAMRGVDEADDVILLLLDNLYFIPLSANTFASPQEKNQFVTAVRERISRAAAPAATPTPASVAPQLSTQQATPVAAPTPASSLRAATKTFFVSLAQAFKLAVFLPVAEERIRVTWWQVPAFALLSLALSFVAALFRVGLDGEFMWYSLPSALFHLPVLLLAAIFVAYALRRSDKTLLLVQVFLMIALAFDLAMAAVSSIFALNPGVLSRPIFGAPFFSLPSLWLALACFVAAKRYTMPRLSRRVFGLVIALVVIALPLGLVYRQLSLWELPYDETQDSSKYGLTNEDIFYSQQKLLDRELAAVQPERKGVTDIFLIGMAGDADQDVFMKEVDGVARLFCERFDADGHTIRLVNNNKSLASSPIASATSLKAALNRVAQVMNKEEDVLFLFLTSHGSASHHFALELWPLSFNQLDPTNLRKLLDDSGIKNRVVVVSACYSGGFINALKDDHTLVISASAPNKNSFGCSNENEWTYFGDAYFNQALRKTHSFVDAFNLATPLIVAREKKEKFDPSNPQMALGTAMRDKLATLEQQLSNHEQSSARLVAMQSNPKSPDKIEQYVNLAFDPKVVAQYYESCVANMHARGPDATVENNPNYFAGLNKSSPQWPRLANAWNRYAEAFCAKANDPDMVRSLYSKSLRAHVPPQDLVPVLKFLASDSGKRWYPAEREAMRQLSLEWAKIQSEIDASLAKTYQDEQARIFGEFYAEKNGTGGKAAK